MEPGEPGAKGRGTEGQVWPTSRKGGPNLVQEPWKGCGRGLGVWAEKAEPREGGV